jgi:peroxiredoxin
VTRILGSTTNRISIIWLVAVMALATGAWAVRQRDSVTSRPVHSPLGDRLPAVRVQTPDGASIGLRERIGRRPALIYVFSAGQCAGCSNLALEFKILKDAFPHIQPLLVGSGSSTATFAPYFDQMGGDVPASAVVDEPQALLHALGVAQAPVVLLTDSTGRIVVLDPRSVSQAAQYPMGRILADLRGALQ